MKPLKILLGNNTLSLLAGSETWTYTLALALKELGHQVSCFSPDLGIIAEKLMTAGIPCYNDLNVSDVKPFSYVLEEKVDHDYDVIIANHNHIVEYLRSNFPRKPIISTIHGIIHLDVDGKTKAPEHPALDSGVNQFVAVSDEIQEKLRAEYGIDSVIIRNAFDVKKFANLKPASAGMPRQFLINSNYSGKQDPVVLSIREAARKMGAKVAAIGENFSMSFDVTRAIEDSDVVFGMGRSVLEGVAAGRLGIVYGRWGMGGPITESNLEEVRHFNFSGRNSSERDLAVSADEIVDMVTKYYRSDVLDWGKQYIARDHNAIFAAERYVQLARELTGELIVRPKALPNTGVDPAARPFRLAKDVTSKTS